MIFTLQGFKSEKVISNDLLVPEFSLNSTSTTFTLPISEEGNLQYRVLGMEASGRICDMTTFFNFTSLLVNGV